MSGFQDNTTRGKVNKILSRLDSIDPRDLQKAKAAILEKIQLIQLTNNKGNISEEQC